MFAKISAAFLRYLSVSSGIEAASVAWAPLGWHPFAFSEIEAFPSAVLSHHYGSNLPGENLSHNAPPNLGDMNNFKDWPDADVDALVGGTPCQSFSVAGLRAGLADPRGNLCLTFLAIADRYRPKWILWENVPGVLSSNGGRDFGAFLGGLGQLGYGWSYRVLDAQYVRVDGFARAVPQRRRRVFVVGYLGDWRRAAAVLFERESLQGDSAPRRQAGQGTTYDVVPSLTNSGRGVERTGELNAKGGSGRNDGESETFVAHALRADGFDASEDGTGRGTPLVAHALNALAMRGRDGGAPAELSEIPSSLRASQGGGDKSYVLQTAVRRLMPVECERLMGFPDGYTLIPYRGKPAADGPRYKALGNSMAVNVMRWIGRRIELVETLAVAAE